MHKVLRMFGSAEGATKWKVLLCLILANLVQGIGIASLVPLIAIVSDQGSEEPSAASALILDGVRSFGFEPNLEILLLLVVGAIVLKSLISLLALRYVGYAVADISTRMRQRLLSNLLNARWSYLTQQSLGAMAQTVNQMAVRAGQGFRLSATMLSNALEAAVYILVGFFVSWELSLLSLALGLLISRALSRYVKQARRAGKKDAGQTNELSSLLSEAFLGIKSLKAMERQADYMSLISRTISRQRKTMRQKVISREKLMNAQEPLLVIFMAAGFYILIEIFEMPIAQLLVIGVILQRTVKTLNKLQQQYQQSAEMEGSYDLINDMLEESAAQAEERGGEKQPTLEVGARFEEVTFSYLGQDSPVLRDLTLEFPARQLTVLTGPSGAGKSTVTDLLLGFQRPQEGRILIDGVPLEEIDLVAWRRMIGYVPQDLMLFTETIFANITLLNPELTEEMAIEALQAAGAWDFVKSLPEGIYTPVGERGGRFSGGQRQRISIARALVHKPKLLILDEVTSALDAATEESICRTMEELRRDITIIAISHRPNWMEVADVVYKLEGKLLTTS